MHIGFWSGADYRIRLHAVGPELCKVNQDHISSPLCWRYAVMNFSIMLVEKRCPSSAPGLPASLCAFYTLQKRNFHDESRTCTQR